MPTLHVTAVSINHSTGSPQLLGFSEADIRGPPANITALDGADGFALGDSSQTQTSHLLQDHWEMWLIA